MALDRWWSVERVGAGRKTCVIEAYAPLLQDSSYSSVTLSSSSFDEKSSLRLPTEKGGLPSLADMI